MTGMTQLFEESAPLSKSEQMFMQNFRTPYTGVNGSGPILNANANLLPTKDDSFRDISGSLDYRLNNGMGVSRSHRKNDSIGGNTESGMHGYAHPSKMFGRDSRTPDLNYVREEMDERARAGFKKMGFKPNETPQSADYFPWQWNDLKALGIGGPAGHDGQYNRNYPVPDADAVARRTYEPAPSRKTKMLSVDTETEAYIPSRTLLHPMKVVSEDRQRMKLQRIPKNTDVAEHVVYENIAPRGMGSARTTAPRVYGDTDVLRQPIGTNDTASRAVHDRWNNGYSSANPLLETSLEDRLKAQRDTYYNIEGKNLDNELQEYEAGKQFMAKQSVFDPHGIEPNRNEFPRGQSGLNGPLYLPASAGSEFRQ